MMQGIRPSNTYDYAKTNYPKPKNLEDKSFTENLALLSKDNKKESTNALKDKAGSDSTNIIKKDNYPPKEDICDLEEAETYEETKGSMDKSPFFMGLFALLKDNDLDLTKIVEEEPEIKESLDKIIFNFNEGDSKDINPSLNDIESLLNEMLQEGLEPVNVQELENLKIDVNNLKANDEVNIINIEKEPEENSNIKDIINKIYDLSLNRKSEQTEGLESNLEGESENKQTTLSLKTNKVETSLDSDNKNSFLTSGNEEDKELNLLKSLMGENKVEKDFTKTFMINKSLMNNGEILEASGTENIVATKETMVSDVIKYVRFMEINNVKELTVKINPKELGQVIITLVQESDGMKAKIMASSKETYSLLNSNLKDLKNGMLEMNLKVNEIQVGISTEDFMSYSNLPQGFFESEFEKRQSNNGGKPKNVTKAEDAMIKDNDKEIIENGKINMLA
ncbi:flagellar hook-length control protein FliK [Clostridium algidicarnis]|uniref:flagellar hook-length control protein FliK n=1 Tax=Clostridium algidicarnis TaxID=37659 RepID=UPI001626FC27|nr:flagellar hook-length control protein FliK [Clostridium algidicarnis]MBB6696408.1 flagellar hook-length control protein FliK [Clostridium algidicarnis]MBU3205735.1 flagellar hook-length control protein FliK [Clostridium algidicarnis]